MNARVVRMLLRSRVGSVRSRLGIVRTDWPHRIGTPRFIVSLIGRFSALAGIALIFGSRKHTSGPIFAQVNQWGADLGFHSRPMIPWGVLFLLSGVGCLWAVRLVMPVLAGWAMSVSALLMAGYSVGAWSATIAPSRMQFDHAGHSLGQTSASFIGALFITERAVWLAITAGALTAIRSEDPTVDPWPLL